MKMHEQNSPLKLDNITWRCNRSNMPAGGCPKTQGNNKKGLNPHLASNPKEEFK